MTTLTAFINSIESGTDTYHSFIGSPDVNYTPTDIHDDALLLKRISNKDMSKVIVRHDWEYGAVYYPYTKAEYVANTLKGKPFYAMVYSNGVYKVYKCLDNNNGQPSTVSPSTINRYGAVTLDDNYAWVYMYQIPINLFSKFSTLDYVPLVQSNETINNLTEHTVDVIQVKNGGYGYTYCNATIMGDGTGATAIVEVLDKVVTKILVTSVGSGYTYANILLLGDGAGASAIAVIPPTGGHSSNAEAELYCNTLMLSASVSEKSDYSTLPYGSTYSRYGLLKNISYNNNLGDLEVDYVQIADAGTNYIIERKPQVTFTGGFDASQVIAGTAIDATAYANLGDGDISNIILSNNGKNYRYTPTIGISSTVGSGGAANAVMKATTLRNFYSLNVSDQYKTFKINEIIKQGDTTAQVLFHDTDKGIIGIYNINGSFAGGTIVEGLSSGASATTKTTSFLNTPETSFNNSNIFVDCTNTIITRQVDQPEKINIALVF
jgi:hypothetical protein